ncbi:hypothetical protein EJB05_48438, partial [Eragrostis curvula]
MERRATLFAVAVASAVLLPLPGAATPAAAADAPSGGCTRICGNISIPFPFGVEPGCYIEAGFNLTCDRSPQPPKLFLGDGTVQVLGIDLSNGTVRINGSVAYFPGGRGNGTLPGAKAGTWWGGAIREDGPYSLARGRNKLLAVGCNVQVVLSGDSDESDTACFAVCPPFMVDGTPFSFAQTNCSHNLGCCQTEIVAGLSSYEFQVLDIYKGRGPSSDTRACIMDSESTIDPRKLTNSPGTLPAVLGWSVKHTTCNGTDINECELPALYPCDGDCKNIEGGYQCQCRPGFEGNAFTPNGCRDIDECAHPANYTCSGSCINVPGTYYCQCKDGTYWSPPTEKGSCKTPFFSDLNIGLMVGASLLLLLALAVPFITRKIKRKRDKKMRQRFFKQNNGLLLQQLISQRSDIGERMIISLGDIKKATNNFDASHEVGRGGHGDVYKGLLDLQVVAIKKSKIVVQREIDDFINEVVILSQINHRNVVKLIGCCLEAEVPLLVYEFISNGTLAQHLHVEGPISLSWNDRLRIALEISKALAYLHSTASIIHRDIKSSNILLDDKLIAKVSDFGASKYIPLDQNGVSTAVQGTIGYLDPMYYCTGRLTHKSDVFSYGVLLIELLTRKKPPYQSSNGEGLVAHFASLLDENGLVDIIDPQIIEEKGEEVGEVAKLAAQCTKMAQEDRPTMREVEMALENLIVTKENIHPDTTSRQIDNGDQTATHHRSFETLAAETSRQYTMEEEIMLSATYPR